MRKDNMLVRLISVLTASVMLFTSMPVTAAAKEIKLPHIEFPSLFAEPASNPNEVFNVTINTPADFINRFVNKDYNNGGDDRYLSPSDYYRATIKIASLAGANYDLVNMEEEYSGNYLFEGLGSEEYPFKGKIEFTNATDISFTSDRALFNYIDCNAEIPKDLTITRYGSASNAVFSDHIVNEDDRTEVNNWSITLKNPVNDNGTSEPIAFSSIFGDIVDNCVLNLGVNNQTTGTVSVVTSADPNAGFLCTKIGDNCIINATYNDDGESAHRSDYTVTAGAGCAGGLVGYIGSDTKFTLNGSNFSHSGNITTDITSLNADDYPDGFPKRNAGGIIGYLGQNSTVTLSCDGKFESNVTAADNAGGLVGFMDDGSSLTIKAASDITIQGNIATSTNVADPAYGNAGGIAGYINNADIVLPNVEMDLNVSAITGQNSSGGLVGTGKFTTDKNFNLSSMHMHEEKGVRQVVTLKGKTCGGLFGILENDYNVSISGSSALLDISSTVTSNTGDLYYGGAIGLYKTSVLSASLTLNNLGAKITRTGSANISNYAGLIAKVESGEDGAYIKLAGNISTDLLNFRDADTYFGGLIADAGTGTFVDAATDSITVKAPSFTGRNAAGLIGKFDSGVFRICGTVDLINAKPKFEAMHTVSTTRYNHAQVVGICDQTLIYGDTNFALKRCANAQNDDIFTWGEILRMEKIGSGVVTYSEDDHTVTVAAPTFTLNSEADFAKLAINMQLNTGDAGGLVFEEETNRSAKLLSSGNTIELKKGIDLRETGLTGFTRDDGINDEFNGTLDGKTYTLTLAIGDTSQTTIDNTDYLLFNGNIYGHHYNSLFAKTADSFTVKDLQLNGEVNIAPTKHSQNFYAAGLSAVHNRGTVTLSGVTQNLDFKYLLDSTVGGAIASVSDAKISVGEIVIQKDEDGQIVSQTEKPYILNGSIQGTANDIETDGTSTFNCDANVGGLFSYASGCEIKLDKAVIRSLAVTSTIQVTNKSSGGLLGYKWLDTETYINDLKVGDTDTPELNVLSDAASDIKTGGLIYRSTGFMQINKLDYSNAKINAPNSSLLGLIVCYGGAYEDSTHEKNALYMELTCPESGDRLGNYTIGSGVSVIGAPTTNYDEFVASTHDGSTANYQGIVSIPTLKHETIKDASDLYQNRVSGITYKENGKSRYYYNLDKLRQNEKPAAGEQLLLWSASRYLLTKNTDAFTESGESFIKYISPDLKDNKITSADPFNLTGLSYYAIDVPSVKSGVTYKPVKIENATFVFNSEEYDYDSSITDVIVRSSNQHYLMQAGLFHNLKSSYESALTLTISGNITFNGPISKISGGLFCGTVEGYYHTVDSKSYPATINCVNSTITLKDLYVRNYESGVAPLFINRIGSYTSINISGIRTDTEKTAYATDASGYAASSLIGNVGSKDGEEIILKFSDIALDSRINGSIPDVTDVSSWNSAYNTEQTIFKNATLLQSFMYSGSTSGIYNFTIDEDWASPLHTVTYGYEITGTSEYVNKQLYYFELSERVSPASSAGGEYTFDTDYFLPYVAESPATGKTVIDGYHELKINHNAASLNQGCGTYGDPYRISSGEQLLILQDILGSKNGNGIPPGFMVNYPNAPNSLSDDTICRKQLGTDAKHKVYRYESGDSLTSADGNISRSKIYDYIRNAYYEIENDITLNDKFNGLGSTNDFETIFRGVIVGKKTGTNCPTITITTAVPFINVAGGSVVKDLNIEYKVPGEEPIEGVITREFSSDESTDSMRFYPTAEEDKISIPYFGGVYGQIIGGDNVIDNVNVTFSSTIVKVTGSQKKLIPVGAYVGVLRNGGLIFRNTSTANKTLANTTVTDEEDEPLLTSPEYYYVNPYVGRVLDGYVVTDDGSTVDNNVEITKNGVTERMYKNYKINALVKPDSTNSYKKIKLNANSANKDTTQSVRKEFSSDRGWSTIELPDAQSVFVLSNIVASGAAAFEFYKYSESANTTGQSGKAYSSWNNAGNNYYGHYAYQSSYDIGRTHLANYDRVGDLPDTLENSGCDDYNVSVLDYSKYKVANINNDDNASVPYLIYYYTENQDITKDNASQIKDLSNNPYNYASRIICCSNTRFSLRLTASGNTTYDLSEYGCGFRGINAMFNNTSYLLNTDRQVINMFGFDGNNNKIKLNMAVYNYGDNDPYRPYGVGFITRFQQNTNDPVKDSTCKNSPDIYAVQNLTIEGSVFCEANDSTSINTGGFAGTSYSGATNGTSNHYYFKNIVLNDLKVDGGYSSGGLVGYFGSTQGSPIADITIEGISGDKVGVSGLTYVGGITGNIFKSSNVSEIIGDIENSSDFKLSYLKAEADDNCCGGLIGNNYMKCNIRNISVKPADSTVKLYIGQDEDADVKSKYVGGLVGNVSYIASVSPEMILTNCTVERLGLRSTSHAGGLIGRKERIITVDNCGVSKLEIESLTGNGGGLIGNVSNKPTISDCHVSDINVSARSSGGMIGYVNYCVDIISLDETKGNVIENAVFNSELSGDTTIGAGGVIGYLSPNGSTVSIIDSVSLKNITVIINDSNTNGNSGAGGVVGAITNNSSNSVTISNCKVGNTDAGDSYDITLSAPKIAGGVIGRTLIVVNINNTDVNRMICRANNQSGGLIGYCQKVTLDTCTVKNSKLCHDLTSGDSSNGEGGAIGYSSNSISASSVTVENVSAGKKDETQQYHPKFVGGIVGYTGGTSADFTDCTLKNSSLNAYAYAAGIIAQIGASTILTVDGCKVDGCSISADLSKSTLNIDVAAGGICADMQFTTAVKNTSVENSQIYGMTSNSKTLGVGGLIGKQSSTLTGYNLYINNNNISSGGGKNVYLGNFVGNDNNQIVKLVGISKNGTDLQPKECGKAPNADSYFIYADYNCIFANNKCDAPYVTTNPRLIGKAGTFVDVRDRSGEPVYIAGDALSQTSIDKIVDDLIADVSGDYKKYSYSQTDSGTTYDIKTISENFKRGMGYWASEELVDYKEISASSIANSPDMTVIVLDEQKSTDIDKVVKEYISLLTDRIQTVEGKDKLKPMYSSIVPRTYDWDSTERCYVETRVASLSYSDGKIINTSNYYDNPNKFTILDVQYTDPADDTTVVFHLSIPVYVKKIMGFEVKAALLSGTDYSAADYLGVKNAVISAHNAPITSYITYTYDRSDEEWEAGINSGENIMFSFEKKVYLYREDLSRDFMPAGTRLTLLDKNNGGRAYTYTVTQSDLDALAGKDLMTLDFTIFKDSSGNAFDPSALTLCDLLSMNADITTEADDEGSMIVTNEANATIRATVKDTEQIVYLTEYEEGMVGQRYSGVSVKYHDSVSQIADEYYLTIQTPKVTDPDNSHMVKSRFAYPDTTLTPYNVPDTIILPNSNSKKDDLGNSSLSYMGGTFVIGNFFSQSDFSIELKGSRQIDVNVNNYIQAHLSSTVKILDAENFWPYIDSSEIFHEFALNYMMYDEYGNQSRCSIWGDAASIENYTISSGQQKIELGGNEVDFEAPQDKCFYSIGENGAIKSNLSYLAGMTGTTLDEFTISADVRMYYNSISSIRAQNFPKKVDDEDVEGIALNAASNFSFNSNQLHSTNMTISGGKTDVSTDRYHVKDIVAAALTYDVPDVINNINGNTSRLGINAKEFNDEYVDIEAFGSLNTSNVPNIAAVDRIRFELSLWRKATAEEMNDSRVYKELGYVPVDIEDYLTAISFDTTDKDDSDNSTLVSSIVYSPKNETSYKVVSQTYKWKPESKQLNIFDITTDYRVYTGTNDKFEGADRKYSNYKVLLTAYLVNEKGNDEESCSNHIIYTNSRIYTNMINPQNTGT